MTSSFPEIYYQYWKYMCVVRFVYFVWHEGEKFAQIFPSYIANVVYNLFHFQIKHFSPILPVLCLIVPDIRFLPHICYTILQQEPRQKIFLNTFCIPWVSLNVMPGAWYYLKLEILWLLKVGWFLLCYNKIPNKYQSVLVLFTLDAKALQMGGDHSAH